MCLQVALHGPRGEAHHANEQALYGWERLPDYEQALATAERFVAELPPDADVSKLAFAHYMRMRALAWNQRYPEAAEAGHRLVGEFAPHADDPAVRTISAAALIRTAAYHARAGDPSAGLDLLSTVEAAYPDRFADWVALSRTWISQMLENGEGGS